MARGYIYEDDSTGWRQLVESDMPNSGVTAATYGDATHVPQIAVNAQGFITSASNVTITGGGGSGITDLTSTGGTITVTNPLGPTTNVDLPTSGVSAGTYGDATHVGSFTVSADGIVTAASQVGISGIAGSGLVKLLSVTNGATQALDTGANAIPTGHGTLYVVFLVRTASVSATEAYTLRVNGDSTAIYDQQFTQISSSPSNGISVAQTSWTAGGLLHGNAGSTGYASSVVLELPFYDNTNFWKAGHLRMETPDATGSNSRIAILGVGYRSTSAIGQITLDTASHLLANSTMTVYGTE